MLKTYLLGGASLVGLLGLTTPSIAQTAPAGAPPPANAPAGAATGGALPQIVVTAQRRSENLQNVPVTVTAVTAVQLTASGITDTQDLAAVTPGLNFPSSEGTALPHLRGIGSTVVAPGAENSVALYVDGVYYATAAGSILSLNNVSQIEVLKGPQGTLFGRNATGGLIQVTTRDPQQSFHGDADFGYGNYNTSIADAYVTGGVAKDVAADLAIQLAHQGDGWGRNLFNGKDTYKADKDISLRSKILWTPTTDTKVRLSFDYENTRSSQGSLFEAPGTASANPFYPSSVITNPRYDVNENTNPISTLNGGGASLRVEQNLGFASFVSTTAYRQERFFYTVDFDLGPAQLVSDQAAQEDKQVSQEFQLQSKGGGPLSWTVGLFYIHEDDGYNPLVVGFGGPAASMVGPGLALNAVSTTSSQKTDSIAGYGQATYEFLPASHLTLGFRYTYESKDFSGAQAGLLNNTISVPLDSASNSFSVSKPTWRVSIDHKFNNGPLIYVSYNRGFKSGGFNTNDPTSPPYQTEKLDAFEVGAKSDLLGRRLRLNASGFYYKYDNIQVSRFINGVPDIYNGARAKIYGIDVDAVVVATQDLTFTAGLEALHDSFTSFPCADHFLGAPMVSSPACTLSSTPSLPYQVSAKGNRLPDTPSFSGDLSVDYKHDLLGGVAHYNLTDSYNSGFYFEPDNHLRQNRFNLLNSSVLWVAPNDSYSLRLYVKNLTDERYLTEAASSALGFAEALAAPRTYGFVAGVKF